MKETRKRRVFYAHSALNGHLWPAFRGRLAPFCAFREHTLRTETTIASYHARTQRQYEILTAGKQASHRWSQWRRYLGASVGSDLRQATALRSRLISFDLFFPSIFFFPRFRGGLGGVFVWFFPSAVQHRSRCCRKRISSGFHSPLCICSKHAFWQ